MADILHFPEQSPRLRLVKSEQRDFELRQLADAADYAGAAVSEITNAVMRIASGAKLTETERILAGGTLEEVLHSALCLISIRGTNEDRELRRIITNWLEANGSGEG
jgi:hypothetical protein